MNRAERRRLARQQAKEAQRPTPVLMVGDGIVASALDGHVFEGVPGRDLPTKVPGKHRWIASASYVLTDLEASQALDKDVPKFLDRENLFYLGIGCWDCEQPLGDGGIKADSACPAPGDE